MNLALLPPNGLSRLVVRALLTYVLLVALVHTWGERWVRPMLPWFQTQIQNFSPELAISRVDTEVLGREHVVRVVAHTRSVVFIEDRIYAVPSGGELTVSTLIGHIWQPLIVLLSIAIAWPASSMAEGVRRLIVAAIACAIVLVADVPMVLSGSLWDVLYASFEPERAHWQVWWLSFLNNGGRLFLGVFAAIVVVRASRPPWRLGCTVHISDHVVRRSRAKVKNIRVPGGTLKPVKHP